MTKSIDGYDVALCPVTTNGRYWACIKDSAGFERVFPYDWVHEHLKEGTMAAVWHKGFPWDDELITDAPKYLAELQANLQATQEGYVEVDVQHVAP